MDPMTEKAESNSPFTYCYNNPISTIDLAGEYAVSVHYNITYKELLKLGYSKEKADLIAHYSSTYSDHPSKNVLFADGIGHLLDGSKTAYRSGIGIDYNKTSASQEEINSTWHSMMSDKESDEGMTQTQAMERGLQFGWDNIFESVASKDGENLGKLGQGIHALQDAVAHRGVNTSRHLNYNLSSFKKFATDMYGSNFEAANLTRSALIVVDVLKGKKSNLKDGDKLDLRGMSGGQLNQFMQALVKQGFEGKIKNVQ